VTDRLEELAKSLVERTDRLASDISYLNEAVQRLRGQLVLLAVASGFLCVVSIGFIFA
jgi:hypothetical protein